MTQTEIGARIKRIRESKGLAQEAFASIADISQGQLCNYERGEHYPALPVLDRICRAGGLRMSDFWREDKQHSKTIPTEEEIGENLRRLRTLKGMTSVALAGKSGVSSSAICDLERGTRWGMITTYLYLAAALDVSLNALIYGEE